MRFLAYLSQAVVRSGRDIQRLLWPVPSHDLGRCVARGLMTRRPVCHQQDCPSPQTLAISSPKVQLNLTTMSSDWVLGRLGFPDIQQLPALVPV